MHHVSQLYTTLGLGLYHLLFFRSATLNLHILPIKCIHHNESISWQ